ncbi:uncharacterized protein MYCGRDRAFT_105813 [Zymoseptoria tritici IPO323]|uniref:Uncharacterized protein n=1 Tax=Zymoseptoria tritici (strain CBS 115943 / IPO323) TaxID=336722 RepID=F9XKH5_ZYMTI|nr:uncharacterized protein MYCGRDRAFT_105813 [Zymoseptoria tritici IPO323]EGP84524.1 hypothetical protein MYCGRDRAFT_105813 [Zymoseptoria tritici IPO323]
MTDKTGQATSLIGHPSHPTREYVYGDGFEEHEVRPGSSNKRRHSTTVEEDDSVKKRRVGQGEPRGILTMQQRGEKDEGHRSHSSASKRRDESAATHALTRMNRLLPLSRPDRTAILCLK